MTRTKAKRTTAKRLGAAALAAALALGGLAGLWPASASAQDDAQDAAAAIQEPATVVLPPSEVLGDCTDAVPVIVASDADAQSDIYSAVTLAGVLGVSSCVVLAGGRDEAFPQEQLDRLASAASGGYVVGGTAAVPEAKLADRKMTRVFGTDRWQTAIAVGVAAAELTDGQANGDDDSDDDNSDDDNSDNSDNEDDSNDDDSDDDNSDNDNSDGTPPAWQQRLATEFSAALRSRSAPKNMCMSLHRNGEPVFERKADTPLLPASLIKLATATVALSELGGDTTFTTRVVVEAKALDAVDDGVLRGDVYLIGSGDPVLATPGYIKRVPEKRPYTDVTELADSVMKALKAQGIKKIEGAIVGDGSWFTDGERDYTSHFPDDATDDTPAVWKRSYVSTNLVGVLSGLAINDGYGSYSWDRRSHARSSDAAQAAASDFDDLLEARGMVISRRPRSGDAPSDSKSTALGAITSPSVSEMLVWILRFSDNTVAEMLLKQVGRHHGDASRAAAAAAASSALSDALGTVADEIVIVDGSGLSVHNRMSCNAALRLLQLAGSDSRFVASLSIAGKTPTLKTCRPRPSSGGGSTNLVYAKTGQLNDSSAIAGVSTASNGDVLTFAMIANSPMIIHIGSCNTLRQSTLNAIARFTYGPSD